MSFPGTTDWGTWIQCASASGVFGNLPATVRRWAK